MIRRAMLATVALALLATACGEDRPNLTLPSRPTTTVGAGTPDTVAPESPTPDTAPPDTAPPETAAPETAPPATLPPETAPPATQPPETVSPDTVPPVTVPADDDGGTSWWWLLVLALIIAAVVVTVVARRRSRQAAAAEWARCAELVIADAQRMLALAPTLVPGPNTDLAIRGQAAQVEQSLRELPAAESVDRRAAANTAAAAVRAWSAGFEAAALQRRSVPPPSAEALESVDAVLEARRQDLELALESLRQS